MTPLFQKKITPDFEALKRNILRQGTPERVHFIELLLDGAVQDAIIGRYDLDRGLSKDDPFYGLQRNLALHRFLGFDTLYMWTVGFDFPTSRSHSMDPTLDPLLAQRSWVKLSGPIQNWEDFERYPWPEVRNINLRPWEWTEKNLPEDMAMTEFTGSILEMVSELMGYESLCMALYTQPDLVDALFQRVGELYVEQARLMCQFKRIGVIWGSDDLGFRTQTLLPPQVLRDKCLPWHRELARIAHENDKLYFLHCCGQVDDLMDDFIDEVKVDAKHSFEDVITPIAEAKTRWGDRMAMLGGFDVDLLCRSSEEQVRQHTRAILDACMPGGGFCLGTGNSVTDYIPLENYLAMLDEGRNYCD